MKCQYSHPAVSRNTIFVYTTQAPQNKLKQNFKLKYVCSLFYRIIYKPMSHTDVIRPSSASCRPRYDLIWAVSSEKVPSSMRKVCKSTSSCTCAKSHPGLSTPLKHSIVSKDSVSGQRRPWSDCADAQSDQDLRRPHTSTDTFSHAVAHFMVAKLPLFVCFDDFIKDC